MWNRKDYSHQWRERENEGIEVVEEMETVNFQSAVAVKCRESDLLYGLLLKMATRHPKILL